MDEKERNQFKQRVDQQTKKRLDAKKRGKKNKDLPGSEIPTLKEWVKRKEKKKRAEEKREKEEIKKEKERQKELEKTAAKMDKQKKLQKLKEEKEATKADKKAAKAEKVATETEAKEKKQSRLALRLQGMIEESDRLMAEEQEKERAKMEKQKRKREAKARRKLRDIASMEMDVKILQEKLKRKDRKITQLCARRDKIGHSSLLVDFKLDFKIGDYKRRFKNIEETIAGLKEKIERKQKKVEKLSPRLLDVIKPQVCKDMSLESITPECEDISSGTKDAARPCSSNSDSDDSDSSDEDSIVDLVLKNYSDSDSESSDEEEEKEEEKKKVPEQNNPSNVQEILRKAQMSLQRMDDNRAAEKARRDGAGPSRACCRKDEPSYKG